MGDKSAIEWTDATWNPVAGCARVSVGCDNCYAAREAATRLKGTKAHGGLAVLTPSGRAAFNGQIRLLPDRLDQPLRWRKPRRVFVNSMSDLFHEDVPDEYIDRVFGAMALADWHTFQVLTKRPARMAEWFRRTSSGAQRETCVHESWTRIPARSAGEVRRWPGWPLPNVWLGTSVEGQAAAEERIPHLLNTPAAVRFVSCEPLLEPVNLSLYLHDYLQGWDTEPTVRTHRLDWVIVGGESGPGARPFDIGWARAIVTDCRAASVPVFVKQLGKQPVERTAKEYNGARMARRLGLRHSKGGDPSEWPEDLRIREFPT